MSHRAARVCLPLLALCTSALAGCHSSAPSLTIVSPTPGSTLGSSQDLDPATEGLQIAVDATTNAPDGSVASASAGGAVAASTAMGGKIHFASVTLPDGLATLTVQVTSSDHDKTATATASYSVDSFVSGCRISMPANNSTSNADPGPTGLVSIPVLAMCRGLTAGTQAGLLENDDVAPTQLQTPAGDGSVSFTATLIPGANTISVVAPGVAFDTVTVTLTSSRCRAEIEPPSGTVFNLAGTDGGVADLDPTTPGLQASIAVKTGCADGTAASLDISVGGTVAIALTGTVSGGAATFAATLPDGVLDVQGFVGTSDTEGASRHATYTSDGTAPTITVTAPLNGGLLGPQDNVGTGSAFVARISGQITGFDNGGFSALEIDQGTAQAMEVPITPDLTTGDFSVDVTLADGPHTLFAKVQRASGNAAVSPTITFTVVSTGTALAVVSPVNGSEVGLSQLTSIGGNAQLAFVLQSAGLVGQTVSVDCGSGVTGTATIAADGSASIPLTLPIASCAGALFRCTAASGQTAAPTTTFTADNTAPGITIVLPTAGPTSQTSTEFKATTSCAGEGQLYSVDNGGTVISTGTVQNNTIDIPSVALHGGQNDFHVTVTDGAGNTGTAEVEVTNSSTAFPTVAFTTPTNGADLDATSSELSCTTPSAPTLNQVQISITGDSVTASGLVLKLTNSSGTSTVQTTPTFANGIWTWSNVVLAPEQNTLMVTATDAAGSIGIASVTFGARCTPLGVTLTFVVSGNSFGYAQDKDHSTPGVQVDAQIATTGAADGSTVRLCSTAASAVPGGCTTPGTGALAVTAGTAVIQSNAAAFTVTLPDGSQTVYAEVTDVTTEVSDGRTLTARANPPTVTSLSIHEDTQGQALNSGPDNALNQAEMDAANGTVHFLVTFGTNSFVAGQAVQILSTSTPAVLGAATVSQNGDGTTTTSVPVALAQLNTGGYQSYVFYAVVTDDAGNKDSTPSAEVNNVPATTLGTAADPFVIAPTPTVSLTSPAPGTTELNASNDVRCSGSVCPDTDPLVYAFAATTSAPDASPEGAHSELTFLANGTAIAPGTSETNPTQTSGSAVSGIDLPISNGPSVALAAQVDDPYGNVATSAVTTLSVDSIPPELSITTINGSATPVATVDVPNFNVVVSVDATGQGTLESGQGIAIYSGTTVVGSGSYAGSSTGAGTLTIAVSLPTDGSYTLVAKAMDAAGNAGASPAQNVTQVYVGPTVTLTSPAAVSGGKLWFGLATESGSICAPSLTFTTTNVPDNETVLAWTVPAGTSCGAPPGNAVSATVTSSMATLSAAAFGLTDGASATLCAQTTNGITSQESAPQLVQCDLDTPTVAWVSPTAGQTFNAYGQTISGQAASTSSSTTALGLASAQLTVTATNGGTLMLAVDQDNTPAVTTTDFVSCTVPAGSGETIYALSSSNCSTTSGSGQLLLPIDCGQLLAHTLTATLTAPSGNAATPATETVNIDVAEPGAASVSAAFNDVTGVGTVTVSTIPGDDQTSGGNPAGWEVRYSATALTASNWSGGTLVTANLAGAFPSGVPSSFQVVLPAGNSLYLGVRAKDRIGNLGDIGAGSVVQVSTIPTGNVVEIDPSGNVPTSLIAGDVAIRVADIDNDGYDDVILNYPSSDCDIHGNCKGQIFIYFGSASGITSSTVPITLTGTLINGYLGEGQAFDVGKFAGTPYVDIAAGEIDFTASPVAADVLVWTGAQLASFKAGTITTLTPTVLSDPTAFIGGTVRAVGTITGGSSAGDDLLINNYQINDSRAGSYSLVILPRGGAWITSGTGDDAIFSSTGSPAAAFISLPDTIRTNAFSGGAATDGVFVEAATFSYTPMGTPQAAVPGLLVSLVYDGGGQGNEHDLRLFGSATIQTGGTISWSQGTQLPTPSRVDVGMNLDVFGEFVSGGKDAIGNASNDLLIADPSNGELYAFDGDQLLGVNAALSPTNYIWYSAGNEGHLIGRGAFLMGDLDGDGKSEITGGNDPSATTSPAYFWFGQTGDNGPLANSPIPALPELPFAQSGCVGSSSPTTFCLIPGRGQRLGRAPLFSSSTYVSLPFGQALRAGHFSSQTSLDLVVLSQGGDSDGSAPGYLVFMR